MGKQHFQLYSKIHQAKHRRSKSYHWVDMDTECESAGCNMVSCGDAAPRIPELSLQDPNPPTPKCSIFEGKP